MITSVDVTPATISSKALHPKSKNEELASTSGRDVIRPSRKMTETYNHVSPVSLKNKKTQPEYDLSLLSNTDVGNLSLYDPDIHKLQKLSPNLESTRLSEISGPKPRELVRPKSLNLQRRNPKPTISRNPSYESSLNDTTTIMSSTPDNSCHLVAPADSSHLTRAPGNTDSTNNEEILKRNSLLTFAPKSSVRKNFFSLSRV